MRSEAEIRKQVEARLKRWLFLIIDGGGWLSATFILWQTASYRSFGQFSGAVAIFMLLWLGVVGLHFLRTIYVELRDWLVHRAVERERRYYVMSSDAEKPKREADVTRLELTDDGELIEFDDLEAEDSYVQRNDHR